MIQTLFWALPSTLIAVGISYYLGRVSGRAEREQTTSALAEILKSTKQLCQNVDDHNTELAHVGSTVKDLELTDELGAAQEALLSQIDEVVRANRRLENDLTCAHHKLEVQAQELDRTRLEARTDVLSGVPNRKSFDESLAYWLADAQRNQECFALVLCDVDHFKWINDTHGHRSGDSVISDVGNLLQLCIRGEDFVARYGGDEFALLLRGDDVRAVTSVAERIRSTAETRNFKTSRSKEQVAVTLSMGLSMSTLDDSTESLLQRADSALYKAKQSGRNRLHVQEAEPSDVETSDKGVLVEA